MTYENDKHQVDDVIQEGMIGDALNAAKKAGDDIKNAQGVKGKVGAVNSKLDTAANKMSDIDGKVKSNIVKNDSIVARARNSVLQFPIYVTQTLRVNEAQIIAKMFERVYTTLVQTVLSHNQILDEEEANDLVFLKNFHTNLKEAADVFVNTYYTPIDEIDSMMKESVFFSQQFGEGCRVDFSVVPCTNQDLILENTRLLNEPLTGFLYLREATNEKTDKATVTTVKMDKDEVAALYNDIGYDEDEIKRAVKMSDSEYEKLSDDEKKEIDKIKDAIPAGVKYKGGTWFRTNRTNESSTKTGSNDEPSKGVDAPKLLRDADIKKINAMVPWTIEAAFHLRTKNGTDKIVRYVIGIKSVMHLIRTQDLADDLQELVTGNIKALQKVRYKTGEIKFSDYFFNIKGLKADAAKHINYNKRWINTLKRLGEYEKINGSLFNEPAKLIANGNVPIPNGTLILAQPDVTMLTNQTGIDLSKVSNAKRLAKSLFLIGVVIVDSSAGTMRVLFPDSDNDWDVQSLAAIDAELAKTDNSQLMKELNRMVNR